MKSWHKFILIILGVIILYRDSFTSAFFQDDKILLAIANSNNPLGVIPNFPYRPISQEIFYRINYLIFGLNPTGYHLVLFAFFVGTLILIFKLAKFFLHDKNRALLTVFFYAFNVSLFANFYWIATSYFTIGAFFFFLTLHYFVKKKPIFTAIAYFFTLGSNEIALVLPIIFILINWLENFWPKWTWFFVVSLPILLWLRALVGFPQSNDYSLVFDSKIIYPLRWYVIRALNFPEGVLRAL